MKVSDREQKFVFRYFQTGKLDTQKALLKVKARSGTAGYFDNLEIVRHNMVSVRPLRWIAVAASFLVLLVSAYSFLHPSHDSITLVSEAKVLTFQLPDSTQVTLAPHSSLTYQEDDCRKVEMTGCAYFQVKHDEKHPFDVDGVRGHVRVLGTQFQVDERTETSVVMVTSGKVFFSARDAKDGVLLTKGMQAFLSQGADKPTVIGGFNINNAAWATHLLHFDNTPLPEVLQELSKYGGGSELTASDMSKRLTGDFSTDSIQRAIQIIEQTLDVKISHKTEE